MNLKARFIYGLTLLWIKWVEFVAGIEIEDEKPDKSIDPDLSWREFLENLDDLIFASGALVFVMILKLVSGPEVDR